MRERKDKAKTQTDSTIGKFRSLLKSLFAVSKTELAEALEAEKRLAECKDEDDTPAKD